MQALRELFTTDIGLLSLLVLVVLMGIAVFFYRWFQARIREEAGAPQPPRRASGGS
jgi:hypothetical protein